MLHPQVRKIGRIILLTACPLARSSNTSETLIRVPAIQGFAAFGFPAVQVIRGVAFSHRDPIQPILSR